MNAETKRHIDAARQILVGVVPNPSTQIDQITNALIYKFMDDMDQSVIKIGGKPTFFTGDLEKYAWVRIMNPRIGSQDRMNLYSEALIKFSQAKQLPELFRDIFKLAVLPYRSPEVLDLFLKEINYFDYSHSEELGNAFEYLLSVMGSQGDAGMFRTPRHIIEFIVDVVNPTKDDKILDPACGTAGFLISAYKHILEQHDGKNDPKQLEKSLTPEQKKKLTGNFIGYDISPEMVRLSRVNMYLHNFKDPQIIAYNTLADEERWGDKFDVILANPPFMSPKGAGKPHSKFTIQASKSEVLFVDYIINHLRPKGRAGIIVPDGIVFASANANKQLRKNLVEDGLFAVVSLPSGVFNPYAGVKTSILLFDNETAKQRTEMLFVRVESDGFDLGAQRRQITKSDLPQALEILNKWKKGEKVETKLAVYVEKTKISEKGNYNLSGDRYRVATSYTNVKWPMVELGEVVEILDNKRKPITKSDRTAGQFPYYGATGILDYVHDYIFDERLVLIGEDGAKWDIGDKTAFIAEGKYWVNNHAHVVRPIKEKLIDTFLVSYLNSIDLSPFITGVTVPKLNQEKLRSIKIPLPPIEVQKEIVEQIEVKQNAIDHAKAIIQNLERERRYFGQSLRKLEDTKTVKLGEIVDFQNGKAHEQFIKDNGKYKVINSKFVSSDGENFKYSNKAIAPLFKNDVVMVMSDVPNGKTIAKCFFVDSDETYTLNQRVGLFRSRDTNILLQKFLFYQLNRNKQLLAYDNGQSQTNLRKEQILSIDFIIPSLEIQKKLVAEAEKEQQIINANKQLIEIYEQKIFDVLSEI